jgi:SOS response regulatory protein OraA/RecX
MEIEKIQKWIESQALYFHSSAKIKKTLQKSDLWNNEVEILLNNYNELEVAFEYAKHYHQLNEKSKSIKRQKYELMQKLKQKEFLGIYIEKVLDSYNYKDTSIENNYKKYYALYTKKYQEPELKKVIIKKLLALGYEYEEILKLGGNDD